VAPAKAFSIQLTRPDSYWSKQPTGCLGKLPAEEATMTTELIDCTPTWEETARMLVHTLQCNPQNEMAREELLRMGKIIDQQQERIKEIRGAL
jgi:hypothetical protein